MTGRSPSVARVAKSAAWTSLAMAVATVAGLAMITIALHVLGADQYGVFTLASAVTGLVATVDFSLSMGAVRSVVEATTGPHLEARLAARRYLQVIHTAYMGAAGVALLASVAAAVLVPVLLHDKGFGSGPARAVMLLVGAGAALQLGTAVWQGVLAGHEDYRSIASATICQYLVQVVVVAALVKPMGVLALGLGDVLGIVANRAVTLWRSRGIAGWVSARPVRFGSGEARALVGFSGPLLAISTAAAAMVLTDQMMVGGLISAGAAGLYALGSSLPTQASSFLFRAFDTAYPRLVRTTDSDAQEAVLVTLTGAVSFVGGLGLGVIAWNRLAIITAFAGHGDTLAETVLVLFAAAWAANVPVHGLCLLLIARGRAGSLVPVVAVGALGNVTLTPILVLLLGGSGAAVATLTAMSVSNLIAIPLVTRRCLRRSTVALVWVRGLPPLAVGGLLAIVLGLAVRPAGSLALEFALSVSASSALVVVAGVVIIRGSRRMLDKGAISTGLD